ncbi:MAG: carboxymuconolactone decarboxylase family protein [Mycetocola sp.]
MSESRVTRLQRGITEFQRVYGPGTGPGLMDLQRGRARDLAQLGLEFNFGDVNSRPGLSLRDRELITLGVLATLGGVDPQLRGHTRGALNAGATAEEVIEAVIHTVQYIGFPRALNAISVVTDALVEAGAELPDPLLSGPEPAEES